MKLLKASIAFIALVSLQIAAAQWLHVPPPVEARGLMMVGGGVPVAGGSAATGNYRPNADISHPGWGDGDDDIDIYLGIDEAVTDPTAGDGVYVVAWETTTVYEVAFPEITGTISALRIHYYGKKGAVAAGGLDFYISQNGTDWVGPQTGAFTTIDVYEWLYVTFSGLSWTNTTDLRVRIDPDDSGHVFYIDVLYIEANP